jgi:hypothetical protein
MILDKFKRVAVVIKTRKQNGGSLNTTGYKGVTRDKRPGRKPFSSYFIITWKDKKISVPLGYYDTAEEAYIARLIFIDSLK